MLRAAMAHKSSFAAVRSFALCGFFASALALFGGCSPRLGDGCHQSTDCSVNGDRACDVAQPGGYCTIVDCSPGGCGDEGYCVRFKPDEPRLARNYCMAKCGDTGDCDRDAYVCRSINQLNKGYAPDDRVAEIVDKKKNGKVCVVKQDEPAEVSAPLSEAWDAGEE
jgi:hypothetical protein